MLTPTFSRDGFYNSCFQNSSENSDSTTEPPTGAFARMGEGKMESDNAHTGKGICRFAGIYPGIYV